MPDRLIAPPPRPLRSDDRFTAGDATVLDFWRWALGDLRMNNVRGYLAEFLVARAVDSPARSRVEWAAYDVITPNDIRIEVKTSAYLQSWGQRKLSIPRFTLTGAAESWNDDTGEWFIDPRGRVDVWVFCLHTCHSHHEYNPLDVAQWRFWVAQNATIDALGQKSAVLSTIQRVAGEGLAWADLRDAVRATVGA